MKFVLLYLASGAENGLNAKLCYINEDGEHCACACDCKLKMDMELVVLLSLTSESLCICNAHIHHGIRFRMKRRGIPRISANLYCCSGCFVWKFDSNTCYRIKTFSWKHCD